MENKNDILNNGIIGHDVAPNTSQYYEILNGQYETGLFLICDHASNFIDQDYNNLGLKEESLERHIAYDIGVAGITRHLNRALDVPAIMTKFSRLVIDPNRGLDDPTLVMRLSDGAIVPGNAQITEDEIQGRVEKYYLPYHNEIDRQIDQAIASGFPPVLLSIHSFTDKWKGVHRPWHITLLWDKDTRFVQPLLNSLKQEKDIVVGENVPYSGEMEGDTMFQHGTGRGLAHALIEIRQDLIVTEDGQIAWADRLARILSNLMSDKTLKKELCQVHLSDRAA